MAKIKEKFDGLREHFTAESRDYDCTYIVRGVADVSEFPATFRWECKGMADSFARLVGISNTIQRSHDVFEVTLSYSTNPSTTSSRVARKDPPANPLARPVIVRWGSGYLERMEDRDLDGKAFIASNGEAYPDGLPIRYPYLIKTITRNEPRFDEDDALCRLWHTTSSRKILCAQYDGAEEAEDNGITFVQVTYQFWKLREDGQLTWDVVKLDAGAYSLDDSSPPKRLYPKDSDGAKAIVTGSVILDGQGREGSAQTPVWNRFKVHGVTIDDFAGLGLVI